VTPRATLVLAPNPSPMTLDGTNTWVLIEPGSTEAIVIDPGPADTRHIKSIRDVVRAAGARVASILLTHGHPDHAEVAGQFGALTRAPVRALDPRRRLGAEGLNDGDVVAVGGLEVRVIATPGHTGDSLSFLVSADHALLTGDTVLGRGTTVVAHPDGSLADYFDSLTHIRRMTESADVGVILPGHGAVVPDPRAAVEFYLTHRAARLAQVQAARDAGDRTARQIVRRVYADVDRGLWPAAELSVLAQLEYLDEKKDA
jgi:glyoxylase-like metal-dependent hydrolase (beta-lactamase superfamily II)